MPLQIENVTEIVSGGKKDQRIKINPEFDNHETIIFGEDDKIGFRAFIAVHNTARGPALGGCRFRNDYADVDSALTDVLRLSRGMTYKNALAKLDLGGGKAVIMGLPGQARPTPAMMHALGQMVESLNGKYVTAEDMCTTESDMLIARERTPHVCGIPLSLVASDKLPPGFDVAMLPGANPSPYTAAGTFAGMRAAAQHRLARGDLKGLRVAVKGAAGAVASVLCRQLREAGVDLILSDRDGDTQAQARLGALAAELGARIVPSSEIMQEDADIYAPCAGGGDINDETVGRLRAKIVAGCANNVLASRHHAEALRERGVLYAPDYAINAGGVICAGVQYLWQMRPVQSPVPTHGYVLTRVENIYNTLDDIFRVAEGTGKDTATVADTLSERGFRRRPDSALSAAA